MAFVCRAMSSACKRIKRGDQDAASISGAANDLMWPCSLMPLTCRPDVIPCYHRPVPTYHVPLSPLLPAWAHSAEGWV